MFITRFISFLIIASLTSKVASFFIAPSIYNSPDAKKKVCQYYQTDKANSPDSYTDPIPYIKCVNDGRLKIIEAKMVTTTAEMCPLQYTYKNHEFKCKSNHYSNQNQTKILQTLCDNKIECSFTWHVFSPFGCIDYNKIYKIDHNNQALDVKYRCSTKRDKFRPFSNKRYSSKFHPNLNNPLRKLSYNRLQMLDAYAPMQIPMPVPIPVPAPVPIVMMPPPPPPAPAPAPPVQPMYQAPGPSQPMYQAPGPSQPMYQAPGPIQPMYQAPGPTQPMYQAPGPSQPMYQAPGPTQPMYQAPGPTQPMYQAPASVVPPRPILMPPPPASAPAPAPPAQPMYQASASVVPPRPIFENPKY